MKIREKKRYLAVLSNKEEVEKTLLESLGWMGWEECGIKVFKVKDVNAAFVRTNLSCESKVVFALTLKKIPVLGNSGSVKGLKRRIQHLNNGSH